MAFFKEIKYSNGTTLFTWVVTESAKDLLNLCIHRGISTDDINTVKAQNRQIEMLVERLLLQIIFGKDVTLAHKQNGMPYVIDSNINISITHTFGAVCIATHPTKLIGVDIERLGTRIIRVRDRFLNELEKRWIEQDNVIANLIAWTAKEALFKVIPYDGIDFKEHLQLEPYTAIDNGQICFIATTTRTPLPETYNILSSIDYDYVLSLAIADEDNQQNKWK